MSRLAVVVVLLLAGCASTVDPDAAAAGSAVEGSVANPAVGRPSDAVPEPATSAAGRVDRTDPLVATGGAAAPAGFASTPARPVAVEIPAIGVAADLVDLGLNDDRTLQVPSEFDVAGWYTGRPPPGAVGPAVIVGHVDSAEGPAVFHRVPELKADDEVLVHREDGSTARFAIDRVERHSKDDFPTQAVYGPTDEATLRLITCGGRFDPLRGRYDDNIVVFATLVAP